MSFDLTKLQPGDEVGIEIGYDGRIKRYAVGVVIEIDPSGAIGLEGDEWFMPDGRASASRYRRLCEPTDEGRLETLVESIGVDLDILGTQLRSMDLQSLRNLRGQVLGWIAGVEAARTNRPVSAPDRSESA